MRPFLLGCAALALTALATDAGAGDRFYYLGYGVVQGIVLFVATAFVLVNFAVDLLYLYLDPRIRYESPG